eukprot:6577707-Karenia_brevis.AAC.1
MEFIWKAELCYTSKIKSFDNTRGKRSNFGKDETQHPPSRAVVSKAHPPSGVVFRQADPPCGE